MERAQKQTHRSMEGNREPRNKPTFIWSINYTTKEATTYNREKQLLQ